MLVCRRFLELATGGTVNCKSIIPNKTGPYPSTEFSVSYAPVLACRFLGVTKVCLTYLQLLSVNHQFIECLGN